jgi:transposase
MDTLTRTEESSAPEVRLLLAFELSARVWKLGFTVGVGPRPYVRQIPAGAVEVLAAEITRAQARFGLPAETRVVSCYEAGREGFWLHRYLEAQGIANQIVDSSSIEVNRRARRTKTDRLDLGGLLRLLTRYVAGEAEVWHVVRVPTVAEEDARHLMRTLATVTRDRTRTINRLKGLLMTVGVRVPVDATFLDRVADARLWDGTVLPPGLQARLRGQWAQWQHLTEQLRTLKAAQRPDLATPAGRTIAQLQTLRAIGPVGAWTLTTELFAWRQIRNRRELAALVGLVPAVYQSGDSARDQGITKAGNRHVRRVLVQLAWTWLRYQPESALTVWFHRRFGQGSKRLRRIGIIALARKLLIALWRFIDTGTVPEGAVLKPGTA